MFKAVLFIVIAIIGVRIYFAVNASTEPETTITELQAAESSGSAAAAANTGQVKFTDRKVILITGTSWCPACKMLERDVIRSAQWRRFAGGSVRFEVYNYPRDNSRVSATQLQLLEKYRISGFPTMLLCDLEGREIGRKVGVQGSANDYIDWISSARM